MKKTKKNKSVKSEKLNETINQANVSISYDDLKPSKPKKQFITVYLYEQDIAKLEEIAEKTENTRSDVICKLIHKTLENFK